MLSAQSLPATSSLVKFLGMPNHNQTRSGCPHRAPAAALCTCCPSLCLSVVLCCVVLCRAEKHATKALEADQVKLKEQLTVMRSQRMAEVSNMQQHAKAMVVSAAAVAGMDGLLTPTAFTEPSLAPGWWMSGLPLFLREGRIGHECSVVFFWTLPLTRVVTPRAVLWCAGQRGVRHSSRHSRLCYGG